MSGGVASNDRRREFRSYLDRTGVNDSLTKVLVSLYEEQTRPEDPIAYIKHYLGAAKDVDVAALREENAALTRRVALLERQLARAVASKGNGDSSSSGGTRRGGGAEGVSGTAVRKN